MTRALTMRSLSPPARWTQGTPGVDTFYTLSYAPDRRTSCKEFRCRRTIEKGELRIGVQMKTGERTTQLGQYCFAPEDGSAEPCLWRTMRYRASANVRIDGTANAELLRGFGALRPEDQATSTTTAKDPAEKYAHRLVGGIHVAASHCARVCRREVGRLLSHVRPPY